jgi:hypothetical protein
MPPSARPLSPKPPSPSATDRRLIRIAGRYGERLAVDPFPTHEHVPWDDVGRGHRARRS